MFQKSAPKTNFQETPKIMIVEDCTSILKIHSHLFSNANYETVTFSNGQEAADHLTKNSEDSSKEILGIVTDWTMPILDGEGLIQFLFTNDYQIPCYVVSSEENIGELAERWPETVVGHHVKPLIEISAIVESFEAYHQNLRTKTDDMTDSFKQITLRAPCPNLG